MNSGLTVMSRIVFAFAAAALLLAGVGRAEAAIVITVDKNTQKLTVMVDGAQRYEWPVSTARRGYRTRSRASAARPRTAASGSIRRMPNCCTRW
jgi:hypothetical protein